MIFVQFSAAAHTSTMNCNEVDGDRPGQPANRNCYTLTRRMSHELSSNCLAVCQGRMPCQKAKLAIIYD